VARPFSKRLVIDASVARRAGGPADLTAHPAPLPDGANPDRRKAQRSRRLLLDVLGICHRLVLTDAIKAEWGRHASRFAQRWLVRMAQKGKVEEMDVAPDDALRDALGDFATTVSERGIEIEAYRREMLKDCHLLEAALAADQAVVSLDRDDRRRFALACATVTQIANVVWVNPERPEDRCADWLKQGASPDEALRLKNYAG
jgi:hypothetical protein